MFHQIAVTALAGLISCVAATPSVDPTGFTQAGYIPRAVTTAAQPYHDQAPLPRADSGLVDASGVRMFSHPDLTGGQPMNHPVAQAQYGLQLLNTHRLTGDPWFLDRAIRQAQRLVDIHVESRGAWWFPYSFDLDHGDVVLAAPWYSQMAQGMALSLYTRLAETTGNPIWAQHAEAVFSSFLLPPSETEPWGVWVDAAGYVWLEEYPHWPLDTSERVLNGHLFAAYGLYDWWAYSGNAQAAALFDGAATTAAHYVPNGFRNPGWASDYSLRSSNPHERYHAIHVNQLLHLHALTGAAVFAGLAEALHRDFPPPAQAGSLRLAATGHTGVRFDSAGKVTARKTVMLTSASGAPFDQRRRILTQSGYWHRITAGMLAGYWVQEWPSIRAARQPVSDVSYFGARRVTLQPGSYIGYTATGAKSITVNSVSGAPVSRLGWFNGRVSVLVSGGSLSGYWLPLVSGVSL